MSIRNHYHQLFKTFFSASLFAVRKSRHWTQAKMAQRLCMVERSYINLEHGKTCCDALTFLLFLIECCDNVPQLLADLKTLLESDPDEVE